VSETLNDLIYRAGIPVTELAKRVGIGARNLLALRNGTVTTPRVGTVAKLAKALRVSAKRVRAACEASRAAAGK
jgi:DNA-binding Xre family transcriptional regulator